MASRGAPRRHMSGRWPSSHGPAGLPPSLPTSSRSTPDSGSGHPRRSSHTTATGSRRRLSSGGGLRRHRSDRPAVILSSSMPVRRSAGPAGTSTSWSPIPERPEPISTIGPRWLLGDSGHPTQELALRFPTVQLPSGVHRLQLLLEVNLPAPTPQPPALALV